MSTVAKDQEMGMLLRVVLVYAAWLTMVFSGTSLFVSVCIVIAAPMFMGSVIWHLWKTHSSTALNRIAFCGALAFFPFLAIQIIAMMR